ncbi:MAG: SDR family oxidoreductase [Streptosporangiaceae bacterium]|jgi:3-oxoacyl-[acyl-carrier protein] reductase
MRHAVVTGAASGIGRAIAADLAADGYRITGVDLQADALAAALSEIDTPATAIVGDLGDAAFPGYAVDTAWAISPVDALVNAAGIYPAIGFLELTAQSWDRVQHVNVRAPVLATQASAVELGSLGIRVNAVAPGFIDVASAVNPVTDEYADAVRQSVLPGRGTPEDVAGAVRFLLSDQARWISGVVLSVDGGSSAGTSRLPPHWTGQTAGQLGASGG